MPVLGSTAATTGTSKQGVVVPAGWGGTVKAALAAAKAGTGHAEIVVIGDSTTYGSGSGIYYSWTQRLYDRLHGSSGIPDGGCGYINGADAILGNYPALTHDGTYPQVAMTGFADLTNIVGAFASTSGNGTDNVQITAPATRIRLHLARSGAAGKAAYSVDGSAETLVDLLRPLVESGSSTNPYDILPPTLITGLSATGTHTLKVRSAGQSTLRLPTYSATANGSGRGQNAQLVAGGSLTQGQAYEYQFTVSSTNGESTPITVPGSFTATSTNKTFSTQYIPDYGHTAVNLYRRNAGSGAYGLVKTVTVTVSAGQTQTGITDDGTVTPTTAPPSSNGLGTFATGVRVEFFADFLTDSGVAVHRYAFSGTSSQTFYDSATGSAQSLASTPVHLGLPTILNATSNINATAWGVNKGANPQYRNPCLLIIQIGTNNFGSSTDPIGDGTLKKYLEDLHGLIRLAGATGAEVCLVMPPTAPWVAAGAQNAAGTVRQAHYALAQATGSAWVDFGTALGPVNTWAAKGYGPGTLTAPHLNVAAYQAEADFLYNNVLAPLL